MEDFILYIIRVLYMSSMLPLEKITPLYKIIPAFLSTLEQCIIDKSLTIYELNQQRREFERRVSSIFGYDIYDDYDVRIPILQS